MSNSNGGASERPAQHRSKVLNVSIPESVYWHIRKCAALSQMSMKEYMAIFGRRAAPLLPPIDDRHETLPELESEP